MRKVVAMLGVIAAVGFLYYPSPQQATAQTKKAGQFLFVQTAQNVAFKDGTLTLENAAPTTVFFSDRPERVTGHVRNDLFMKLWTEGKNSFKSDPPNASLSIFDAKGSQTAVVELSNPRVEGKNIVYNARTLRGTIPEKGAAGALFIDGDYACSVGVYDTGDPGYPCWAQKAFSPNG
jgi:hypothetical protein